MNQVRSLEIPKPSSGRRFAISDIHGCAKTFKALLKQINLTAEDQLFILGDTINRGPRSAGVLKKIIKMKQAGLQVYLLKGNHEDIILKADQQGKQALNRILSYYNSTDLASKGKLKDDFIALLNETYHYFILDRYYLVHAGFDFSKAKPFEDHRSMMYIKDFKPNKMVLEDKRIVLGHSPRSIGEIMHRLRNKRRKIHIDNGCINHKTIGQGHLLCLNLDTLAVSLQQNLDIKKSG